MCKLSRNSLLQNHIFCFLFLSFKKKYFPRLAGNGVMNWLQTNTKGYKKKEKNVPFKTRQLLLFFTISAETMRSLSDGSRSIAPKVVKGKTHTKKRGFPLLLYGYNGTSGPYINA